MRNVNRREAKYANDLKDPAHACAVFTLDGANDPSAFSGHISEVQRLATATPAVFFRVTFKEGIRGLATGVRCTITTGVNGTADTDDLTVQFYREGLTDDGGDTFVDNVDLDIIVRNGGTIVDTAGIQVHIQVLTDRVE